MTSSKPGQAQPLVTAYIMTEGVFRIATSVREGPLLIDVSRSGTHYPPEFQPSADFRVLHAKLSPYVERIVLPCVEEGATVLIAEFPPTFIDPNRPIDDIDPTMLEGAWPSPLNPLRASLHSGSGLIHTLGADYTPLYGALVPVDDVKRRLCGYYTPYHRTLSELLFDKRRKFGHAFQLSCHSMSSVGPKDGVRRPEICLGDLVGATATPAYIDLVATVFRDHGFEVAFNNPFRGNELLRRHASPATGIYSLQVEMRRDLYIDEKTRRLSAGLAALVGCFRRITAAIEGISHGKVAG